MSRAPRQVRASHSIMRTLSEVYLSIFVLFYRITLQRGWMRSSGASFGAQMVALFIGFTFWGWIEVMIGREMDLTARGGGQNDLNLNTLVVVAGGLVNFCAAYFYLKRHGLKFEKRFCGFSGNKQITLYLAAVGVIVVIGIAFVMVGTEYREMFHPPGK